MEELVLDEQPRTLFKATERFPMKRSCGAHGCGTRARGVELEMCRRLQAESDALSRPFTRPWTPD